MSKCYALSVVLSINDNKYNAQHTNYHFSVNPAVRFAVSYKYIMLFIFFGQGRISLNLKLFIYYNLVIFLKNHTHNAIKVHMQKKINICRWMSSLLPVVLF